METEAEILVIPDQKQARRTASLCAFATVAVHLIATGLMMLCSYLLRSGAVSVQATENLELILTTIINDLIAMPLCWLIFLKRLPKNEALAPDAPDKTPLRFGTLLFYLPCVYALGYAGALTGKLVGLLFEGGLTDVIGDVVSNVNPWITLLCTVIVGPVAEELFFRKALIDRLSRFHPTDAILLSALLFGLIHSNLTQFLYAFPIGVLLGIIYWRTKNIRYTILLHMLMNTLGGLLPLLLGSAFATQVFREIGTMLYGLAILGLVVVGIVFLIRFRKRFLPIASPLPRCRKPFCLNVGWFVACAVFVAMFVYIEFFAR